MNGASAASLSFTRGDEIVLVSDEPLTLAERIASRVASKPDGVIRSYREDGRHQARSRAWLWRQAGDIATALCAAGAVPATPVVILAEDILDFVPSFWGCLRAAAIPVALMNAAKEAAHRDEPAFGEALGLLDEPIFIVDEYFADLLTRLPLATRPGRGASLLSGARAGLGKSGADPGHRLSGGDLGLDRPAEARGAFDCSGNLPEFRQGANSRAAIGRSAN